MSSQIDFPKIESQRGFASLLDAAVRCEIPNSNLIVCRNIGICVHATEAIAKKILSVENLETCVDFWPIRPSGAMGQISVDQIREVCARIYLSPKVCRGKVVAIYGAEYMHPSAANAFLKTLEEPPANTTIILTTAKFHAILPTITGRCSVTHIGTDANFCNQSDVQIWIASYSAWLASLFDSSCGEKNMAIMRMYLLLAQLESAVEALVNGTAVAEGGFGESSGKREIYATLLLKIENETAEFFRKNEQHIKFFPKIILILEGKAKLIAINVNFMACVEAFLIEIFRMITKV
jgi:hypothetical protein